MGEHGTWLDFLNRFPWWQRFQHDAENVQLYLEETLTFLCYTAEASVALTA